MWELFKLARDTNPRDMHHNVLSSVVEVLQLFINKGYDLLCGKKLTEPRVLEVVARAFIHNVVIKHED